MKKIKSSIIVPLILLILLQFTGLGYSQVTILTGEAERKPWSSYWWQTSVGKLVEGYRGHPAPVEKYDLYVDGYFPGPATWSGSSLWYNPYAPSWYGLCHAWVNASILETMEIQPSSRSGVFFAIGDKKGLLCACHAEDEIIYKRCLNNPEYFHRYLLDYIGEQGVAIGADLDPSAEFWSYPIFKYEMEITPDGNTDYVKCTITHAHDFGIEPDFCGTKEVIKIYEYSLEKDSSGAYLVGGGQWLGESQDYHPDMVWVPVAVVQEDIILDYHTVLDIARSQGDGFTETTLLQPGHHLLIPSPRQVRTFTIKPRPGETFICSLGLDEQTPEDSRGFFYLDKNHFSVTGGELSDELQSLELKSDSGYAEFELTFFTDPESESGAFIHLYVEVETECETYFMDVPTRDNWFGTAFTGNTPGRAWLQIVGNHGLPMAGEEVAEITTGRRQICSLTGRQTYDYFKKGESGVVKLSSTTPLTTMYLLGNDLSLWGGVGHSTGGKEKRVATRLSKVSSFVEKNILTLLNRGTEPLGLSISYFADDGEIIEEQVEYQLSGKETASFMSETYPGGVKVEGWALLTPDADGLEGCTIREEKNKSKDLLPLLGLAKEFAVIHLAASAGWQTTLNLFNANASETTITLRLHSPVNILGQDVTFTVPPWGRLEQTISVGLWGLEEGGLDRAWIEVKADADIAGYFNYRYSGGDVASMPLVGRGNHNETRDLVHIANDAVWWTGMAVTNLTAEVVEFDMVGFDADGLELESISVLLNAYETLSELANSRFGEDVQSQIASIKLENAQNLAALAVYGTVDEVWRISAFCW